MQVKPLCLPSPVSLSSLVAGNWHDSDAYISLLPQGCTLYPVWLLCLLAAAEIAAEAAAKKKGGAKKKGKKKKAKLEAGMAEAQSWATAVLRLVSMGEEMRCVHSHDLACVGGWVCVLFCGGVLMVTWSHGCMCSCNMQT